MISRWSGHLETVVYTSERGFTAFTIFLYSGEMIRFAVC
jgi:hypothetical protein